MIPKLNVSSSSSLVSSLSLSHGISSSITTNMHKKHFSTRSNFSLVPKSNLFQSSRKYSSISFRSRSRSVVSSIFLLGLFSNIINYQVHAVHFLNPERYSSLLDLNRDSPFDWSAEEKLDINDETEIQLKGSEKKLKFYHGTTTIAFIYKDGIVAAVDSRASLGSFVGSKTTQKVLPINKNVIGTMAGGAADCMFWIRKLRSEAKLYELNTGKTMPVSYASKLLANALYEYRGLGLSIGTMIMGFDSSSGIPSIYYVDNSGARIKGDLFAV